MMMENAVAERRLRKTRIGVVVTDGAEKTVVVAVERRKRHPLYGKVLRLVKKYHVHDEHNRARVGNRVRIAEVRPLSRLKRWRLVEILDGDAAAARQTEPAGQKN